MLNETYKNAANALKAQDDTNFCGPLALSIVSGRDITEVNNDLIRRGLRQYRRGMSQFDIIWWLRNEGFNVELTDVANCTMTTVGRRLPRGKFLVFIRGHVAAVVDREVKDWTEGRKHRVKMVYRVTPKNAPAPVVEQKTAKARKTSKSYQMLDLLRQRGGCASLEELACLLNTSVASVRCYVSYFKNGSRGHEQRVIRIHNGSVIFFD